MLKISAVDFQVHGDDFALSCLDFFLVSSGYLAAVIRFTLSTTLCQCVLLLFVLFVKLDYKLFKFYMRPSVKRPK